MAWTDNRSIILEMRSPPVKLKYSSLRQFRLSLTLAVLLLFCVGLSFASGLIAIKRNFQPSEQLQAQKQRLELTLRSEYPSSKNR